jgi:hypothetical protein
MDMMMRSVMARDERHPDELEDRPARDRRLDRRTFLAGSMAAAGLIRVRDLLPAAAVQPLPDLAIATIENGGLSAAVHATLPAEVRLRAWPVDDPTLVQQGPWVATNRANTAKVVLPNAGTAERAWAWQSQVRDPLAAGQTPADDIVRTIPSRPAPGVPSAFTFAFGCCTTRNLGTSFKVVRNAKPQFFAMIGDFGYLDRPNPAYPVVQDYDGYTQGFGDVMRHPRMTPITATTPLFPMSDDHDLGLDNCNRTNYKTFAARAFDDVMPGGPSTSTHYRSWSIGDVDFFLTDNRRWKDPDLGPYENGHYMTVLGSVQKTWLLQSLVASSARLKCVFIPMTMAWYWAPAEGQEVRKFIADNVSGTVIFLSGDKHAGAFACYTPTIWEFLAAPLYNSTKHQTPARSSAVIWTENGTGTALYNAVGLVDVDTSMSQTCTLRLVREDGVEMHREVVPLI